MFNIAFIYLLALLANCLPATQAVSPKHSIIQYIRPSEDVLYGLAEVVLCSSFIQKALSLQRCFAFCWAFLLVSACGRVLSTVTGHLLISWEKQQTPWGSICPYVGTDGTYMEERCC